MRNKSSIILLVCTILILFLFYSLPFRKQNDVSEVENRTMQHVPKFSFASFKDGTFQKQMEDSIGDQLLFSSSLKYGTKRVFNALTAATANMSARALKKTTPQPSPKAAVVQPQKPSYTYTEVVAGKVYKLDDSGYLVQKPTPPENFDYTIYDPAMIAAVTEPKYLYFINSSVSTDFNNIDQNKVFEYVKKQFPGMTGYAQLTFNSFEEYKKLFYQTDHHWNYKGSYLGYKQIMRLMEGDSVSLLEPVGIHMYNAVYRGSLARDNLLHEGNEKFTVYLFNLPEHTTFVNDKQMEYGYRSWYVSDTDFPHKEYTNHYGLYYGDDRAKVVFKYDNPDAESILILATSFSNAINELVASHYKETHIFDYRHYKKFYGTDIDAQKYMTENHLTKLLIMGDLGSLGYEIKEKK